MKLHRSYFSNIFSQRRNHGVLILSEFAGAAQTLGSGAILINPFNTAEVSQANSQQQQRRV